MTNNTFQQNEIQKQWNQALRNIFKNQIKGNFLIEIKSRVVEKLLPQIHNFYNFSISNTEIVSGNNDSAFEYDICNHIVGIHSSNSIFLTEDERIKNEKNESYKTDLIEDVITHVKLRPFGSSFFRNKQICAGEQFIYYSVPYKLFVMSSKINYILTHSNKSHSMYPFYATISNKGLAILSLLEDNFYGSTYPLCRGMLELFIKMLVIKINNNQEEYMQFIRYEINKNSNLQDSEDFSLKFENRINKECLNTSEFLNYGWVDSIPNYHKIVKSNPYSFYGLIYYLQRIMKDESYKNYNFWFKRCHAYTHGSIESTKYPLLHYFEICLILYPVISNTYKIICDEFNIDIKINDVDIISKAEKDYVMLTQQYNNKTTEKFDLHYKKHINKN